MALNDPTAYGIDYACVEDFDATFSTVTGLALVVQDAIHRVTTDDVLGPGGDGWGRNCFRLLGLDSGQLAAQQPLYAEVLQRDERVETADVALVAVRRNGLDDVDMSVTLTTAFGPFANVFSVRELSNATLDSQANTQ